MTPPSVLVSYLVAPGDAFERAAERFLASYAEHEAGMEHDRLLVLKEGAEYPDCDWGATNHPNEGLDIGSLLRVSREYAQYRLLMWFGSHARILADGWLAKFCKAMSLTGVGAAAASGSFEAGVLREAPNAHLRTAALMVSPAVLNSYGFGLVTDRRECYEFEHGSDSLYRRLCLTGLRGVVVGRSGRVYREHEWATSGTYRHGEQEELLVADKQSDAYAQETPEGHLALARLAGWEP